MSYTITGGFDVVKQLQYVEETTFGTTPSSPTFTHAGPITEMNDNQEAQAIKYRQIGNRDIYAMIKTGELYSFDVTFNPLATDLLEYAINLPGVGSKNIGKSLSFLKSQKVNGTENYTLYTGAVAESCDISIEADGAVEVTINYICRNISTPATSHGLSGTVTFGTNPTAVPWTNLSGGTAPLKIGPSGSEVTVDTDSWSTSITHNIEQTKINGDIFPKFVTPTFRDITFEFDTLYKDTVLIADQKSNPMVGRSMQYTLKTTPGARLDYTNAYFETMETTDATSATEPKKQSFTGTSQSLVITAL